MLKDKLADLFLEGKVFVALGVKPKRNTHVEGPACSFVTTREGVIVFTLQVSLEEADSSCRLFVFGKVERVDGRVLQVLPVSDRVEFLRVLTLATGRDYSSPSSFHTPHFLGDAEKGENWRNSLFAGIEPGDAEKVLDSETPKE